MPLAPDVLWVLLALPLTVATGSAIALLATPARPLQRSDSAQLLALAAATGLLVDYALGMLLPQLRWVLPAACAIAAASLAWVLAARRTGFADLLGMGWLRWLLALALVLSGGAAILFEPVQGWDARSIWFFAAKRIFFNGGMGGADDWTSPAYRFSHADYPKLLPLLAAQFADAWGVWNEYIPKASLLALLAPAAIGLMGLARRVGLSLAFLAGALLLTTSEYLWNGYADTYLAIYAAISLVYFSRWLGTSAPLDLAAAVAFSGIALNLKNEGSLLVLCTVAVLAAWLVPGRRGDGGLRWRSWPAGVWIVLLLPWIGFAGWALTRGQWQLSNDLQLGAGSLQRVLQRLGEGQLAVIAKALLVRSDAGRALLLLLVAAVLARALRTPVPATAWFPAAVAALYAAGLFSVYLATPHDLAWHLATSADRTMVLVAFGFVGSTFLVLEAMEARDPARPRSGITTGLQT